MVDTENTAGTPGTSPANGRRKAVQPSLLDRGEPLSEITFVVVDLETTGVAADSAQITEIGAIKVRGGEILGEFATLVNPGEPIDARITMLTGISDDMVASAPRIAEVLPAFLEFAAGTVLVAHNAPFDVGFLKAAADRCGYAWPKPRVVDTVVLARRLVDRDEVPNKRLGTLARYFRATVSPNHRALADARATVDVLHALFERLGGHGVHTYEELAEFGRQVPPELRAKRKLAERVPDSPGVYIFRDADDQPLYVGTSINMASRVRSYFTAGETRRQMREMVRRTFRIETVECAHGLEAEVRELRMIAAHKPPFNRRSKHPEGAVWLKLTSEPYPRLSVVHRLSEKDSHWLGPFSSRGSAEATAQAIVEAVPLRQCTPRLSLRTLSPACALAELGKCPAPCRHEISADAYGELVTTVAETMTGDPDGVVRPLLDRIGALADMERFEDAAVVRERLAAFLRAAIRTQRLAGLTRIGELTAARRAADRGWDIAVVRHGRLVSAAHSAPGVSPMPSIEAALATAETVVGTLPAAYAAETEKILNWLEHPDTRLVHTSDGWSSPARGAARHRPLLAKAEETPALLGKVGDRRNRR
ncbi:DEDD exonuclease domain-containing protein [Actinorhabdospora filicis]|uniref:DEDD exonuclease domain-containing protein n=1 Tax=Actinorhabdospora filicis TaxID=1785913 RepID=UPI002557700A|nr:DEDD exonuclease domain-containing protein [Actinorhabdospora filicis]